MPFNRRATKRVRRDAQARGSVHNDDNEEGNSSSQFQNQRSQNTAGAESKEYKADQQAVTTTVAGTTAREEHKSPPRGSAHRRRTNSSSSRSSSRSLSTEQSELTSAASEPTAVNTRRILPPRAARPPELERRDNSNLRRSSRLSRNRESDGEEQENKEERRTRTVNLSVSNRAASRRPRTSARVLSTTLRLGIHRPREFEQDEESNEVDFDFDDQRVQNETDFNRLPLQVLRLLLSRNDYISQDPQLSGDLQIIFEGDSEAEFEFGSDEDEDCDYEIIGVHGDSSDQSSDSDTEEEVHLSRNRASPGESESDEEVAVADLTSLSVPRIELIGGSRKVTDSERSQTFELEPTLVSDLNMSENSSTSNMLAQKLKMLVKMLREGCGSSSCTNPNCASCVDFAHKSNDEPLREKEAVKIAVRLLRTRAHLCPIFENELDTQFKDKKLSSSTAASSMHAASETSKEESKTILTVFDAETYAPLPSETVTFGQVWRLLASIRTSEELRQSINRATADATASEMKTSTDTNSISAASTIDDASSGSFIETDGDSPPEEEPENRPTPSASPSTQTVRTGSVIEARIARAFATPFLLGHAFKQARPSYSRICQLRLDLKHEEVSNSGNFEKLVKSFDESLETELSEQSKQDQAAAAGMNAEANSNLTQRFLAPAKVGSFRRPAEQQDDAKESPEGKEKDSSLESKESFLGPNPLQPEYVHSFIQLLNKIVDGENVIPDESLKPYDWKSGAKKIVEFNDAKNGSVKSKEDSASVNSVVNSLTQSVYCLNLVQGSETSHESVLSLYPPRKEVPSRLRDAYGTCEGLVSEPMDIFTPLTEQEVSAWIESEKETTEKGWMSLDCTPNHVGIDFVSLEQLYNAMMKSPLAPMLYYAIKRSCQAIRRATSRNFPAHTESESKNPSDKAPARANQSEEASSKNGMSAGNTLSGPQSLNGGTLAGHFNGVNFYSPVPSHGLPFAKIYKNEMESTLSKSPSPHQNAVPDPTTPRVPSLLIESVRYLRGLLILLEFPGFDDIQRLPSFNILCRALHRASTSALKPVLCNWLANYPVDRLRRIVEKLQHYSTLCWIQQEKLDSFKYPTNLLVLIRRISSVIENSMPLRRPAQEFNRAVFQLHISKAIDAVTTSPALYQLQPPIRDDEVDQGSPASEKKDIPVTELKPRRTDLAYANEFPVRPWIPLRSIAFCERHFADQLANLLPEHNKFALLKGPVLRTEEFYNDAVNEDIDVKEDYRRARSSSFFSFWRRPFILDASTKSKFLQLHASVQMQNTARGRFFPTIDAFLLLDVRRSNLIEDTLVSLHEQPKENLKKPLRVRFTGEEGIDQGGVRKEFFQLLTNELFDPKFGMFKPYGDRLWFSSNSLESDREFELIGMLLGLAIYNSVTLDLKLPPIVYSKLLKRKPTLEDFSTSFPKEATALIDLLCFEGPESGPGSVEDIYSSNFTVTHDNFGASEVVELKPGGANIPLTAANRGEFVELKIDWICNRSIGKQYLPFHRGFHSVAGSDVLEAFAPEELQLLVCGSERCDFYELEQGARYDDGYTKDSRLMKWLWEILHELSLEDKKKFLFFCTGSDRVPISGLRDLKLVISRNGPDSNILPTAHTCFNHLLLPDYSSKDRLRTMLQIAISNSQGFGLR